MLSNFSGCGAQMNELKPIDSLKEYDHPAVQAVSAYGKALWDKLREAGIEWVQQLSCLVPVDFENAILEMELGEPRARALFSLWNFVRFTPLEPCPKPKMEYVPPADAMYHGRDVMSRLEKLCGTDNLRDVCKGEAPLPNACLRMLSAGELSVHDLAEISARNMAGSAELSHGPYLSGVSNYCKFVQVMRGVPKFKEVPIFPADSRIVLLWTSIFRNAGTISNYIAAVKWASRMLGFGCDFDTESVRAAIRGIRSQDIAPRSIRGAIGAHDLLQLVRVARRSRMGEFADCAILAYNFLLRVGSELCNVELSNLTVDGNVVNLKLPRRKNKTHGSVLQRAACDHCPELCPVAAAKRLISRGGALITSYTYPQFLKQLRELLGSAGIPNAAVMGTHAFRRGAARDMVANGCSLEQLLMAGEWRSHAWRQYLSDSASAASADSLLPVLLTLDEQECPE